MKKHFLGLFAFAMAIALSSFTLFTKEKADTQVLTWHKYNAAGTMELVPIVSFTGTELQARVTFGCPDAGAVICARAYSSSGDPLNRYIAKDPQ